MPPTGVKWVSQVWIRQSQRADGQPSVAVPIEEQTLIGPLHEGVYVGRGAPEGAIGSATMTFDEAKEAAKAERSRAFTRVRRAVPRRTRSASPTSRHASGRAGDRGQLDLRPGTEHRQEWPSRVGGRQRRRRPRRGGLLEGRAAGLGRVERQGRADDFRCVPLDLWGSSGRKCACVATKSFTVVDLTIIGNVCCGAAVLDRARGHTSRPDVAVAGGGKPPSSAGKTSHGRDGSSSRESAGRPKGPTRSSAGARAGCRATAGSPARLPPRVVVVPVVPARAAEVRVVVVARNRSRGDRRVVAELDGAARRQSAPPPPNQPARRRRRPTRRGRADWCR